MKDEVRTKIFDLDASNWTSRGDVCDAILKVLGAPTNYSSSLDALLEFMVWDDIKVVDPPYVIRVHNVSRMQAGPTKELRLIRDCLDEARVELKTTREKDMDMSIQMIN